MKLSVIGFGHMGSAIAEGAAKAGLLSPGEILAIDRSPELLERAKSLGFAVSGDPASAKGSDVIIIAVRPADLGELLPVLRPILGDSAAVSICAGKKLSYLEGLLGEDKKIIRVMPNTPALVGEGMSAVCPNKNCGEAETSRVLEIFESFGRAEIMPESLFDCVTAVSGSGPAYVYSFISALSEYAQEAGMSAAQAVTFAAQTVLGSAKMVLEGSESPIDLKKKICTPNGTTVEAVKVLDGRGFEDIIKKAAKACEERSNELGK